MTIHPMPRQSDQPTPAKVSVLGILFFLLGTPHIYEALKRREQAPGTVILSPQAAVIVTAGIIAAVIEFFVLL